MIMAAFAEPPPRSRHLELLRTRAAAVAAALMERRTALLAAVRALPEKDRLVVTYRYFRCASGVCRVTSTS